MSVMQRFRSMMLRGRLNELMQEAVKLGADETAIAKTLDELQRLDPTPRTDLFARDGGYVHESFKIIETKENKAP